MGGASLRNGGSSVISAALLSMTEALFPDACRFSNLDLGNAGLARS
jgi:hypothetical protein